MSFKRTFALVALVGLLLAACGSDDDTSSGSGGTGGGGNGGNGGSTEVEVEKMKTVLSPGSFQYYSEVVAEEQGFYDEVGLDVEQIDTKDGPTTTRLLSTGEVDGGILDATFAISATAAGEPLTIGASIFNRSIFQIAARGDLLEVDGTWEEKVQALEGRKVGVPGIGGGAHNTLRLLMQAVGMDPDEDVQIIQLQGIQPAIAQFQEGAIDAMVTVPPQPLVMDSMGIGDVFIDVGDEVPLDVVSGMVGFVGNPTFVSDRAEVLERWKEAHELAIAWISDPANAEEATTQIAELFTNSDEDLAAGVLELLISLYETREPGLAVKTEIVEAQVASAVEQGTIEEGAVTVDDIVAG